jgi:predicted  nucleic acid-binding Zn-ribbon protein
MVDADSVLLNVQEREKWRRRMALLERSLEQVRNQRIREELRLRRVRKDIAHLQATLDAVLDGAARQGNPGRYDGTQRIPLTYR